MTDINKTINRMRRYANACDAHSQIVPCSDIAALCNEVERLNELNEMRKEIIRRHHASDAGVAY